MLHVKIYVWYVKLFINKFTNFLENIDCHCINIYFHVQSFKSFKTNHSTAIWKFIVYLVIESFKVHSHPYDFQLFPAFLHNRFLRPPRHVQPLFVSLLGAICHRAGIPNNLHGVRRASGAMFHGWDNCEGGNAQLHVDFVPRGMYTRYLHMHSDLCELQALRQRHKSLWGNRHGSIDTAGTEEKGRGG